MKTDSEYKNTNEELIISSDDIINNKVNNSKFSPIKRPDPQIINSFLFCY
jgi:hypothetical protein